ncbi:hypothetical protein ACFLSI_05505 [Bacteroidota bacterium]
MKTIKYAINKISRAFLTILVISLIFSSCEEYLNNVEQDEDAPKLPSISTFFIDFNDFPDTKSANTSDSSNYIYASANVLFWNVFLSLNMIVPVASFLEAFNHYGEYDPDENAWVWTYSFNAGGVHEAELQGSFKSGKVIWEMYISKANNYTDFLWYSGEHNLLATEGSWTINKDPQTNPQEYLEIEWQINPSDSTMNMKFTNIIPGNAENGSYISSGTNNDPVYDLFYDIYSISSDTYTNIQWNKINRNGRVKNTNYFGDNLWHCWDTTLMNIDCN